MMEDPNTDRLTLRQAARMLDVSPTTLRRMIDRGQLPAELQPGPFGERWMVPLEAVEHLRGAGGTGLEETPGGGGDPPPGGGGAGPDALLLERALELAHRHLDRAQDLEDQLVVERSKLEAERERAARSERMAEELRYALTQHQRALTEAAESLAQERAKVLELSAPPIVVESESPLPVSATSRRGWGSRVRRWLLGERAG